MENRFNWGKRPKASEGNTVKGKGYRFTVLTDSLIRIELNKSGAFEDRASQTAFQTPREKAFNVPKTATAKRQKAL